MINQSRPYAGIFAPWFCLSLLVACGALTVQAGSYQVASVIDEVVGSPAGGAGDSGAPVLSSDGRYVLFASAAHNLVLTSSSNPIPTLSPARLNVYLKDRVTGLTELISMDPTGTAGGNNDSFPAQISANGQFVLFESTASNLVAGDTNGVGDVFVRDRVAGTTVMVSRTAGGICGNGASHSPVMTPSGRLVAFTSAASNLTAADTNGIPDIFIHDLLLGATALVSVGAESINSPSQPSASDVPWITPDGRFIAFYSTATNLVPGVTDPSGIYVRDLLFPTTHWASANADSLVVGPPPYAYNHRISSDGQYVAFEAGALGVSAVAVLLRHHLPSEVTEVVETNAIAALSATLPNLENLAFTPDGRFMAYLARSNNNAVCVRRWDAQSGLSELISGTLGGTVPAGTVCEWPVMDASGRYVAFLCNAAGLTTNAVSSGYHLYVRDTQSGTTRLMDASTNGMSRGLDPSAVPAISDDGQVIAFECPDGQLVAGDHNHDIDVFVKDLATEAVGLVSAHHPDLASLTPNGPSLLLSASVSSNGQFVAFASDADNLVVGDTNGVRDIFVRDRLTGTNVLVTVSTNGGSANGISTEPAISGDGRYVAFTSYADNLIAGDTNKLTDVFVRDLQAETTLLISLSTNGMNVGDGESAAPTISADGRYVLYESSAKNLAPGSFTGYWRNLFLRDTTTYTNHVFTYQELYAYAMSPDGHFVAFAGAFAGFPSKVLYVWDTQLGARVYTNSTYAFEYDSEVSLSPDGQRLAFWGSSFTLQVVDLGTGTNRMVVSGGLVPNPGLSFDNEGRFLAYATSTSNDPADANTVSDVYLYDFQSNSNLLVSRATSGMSAGDEVSDHPVISSDGRFVAYRSDAANIVGGDGNGFSDVFLYDRLSGVTTLLSTSRFGNAGADNHSLAPWFSADGSTLLWTGWASDQVGQDFNHYGDVFAFKLPPASMTDGDNDDMDDQWELDHFMTTDRDGTEDFDHDGASDLFEFQTCTDPRDPGSLFRGEIVFTISPGPQTKLTWTAAPGKGYRVEWKASLSDPEWQDLGAAISVLGDAGMAFDPSPGSDRRFYRIALISP